VTDSGDPELTRTKVCKRAEQVPSHRAARQYCNLLLDAGFRLVTVEVHTGVFTDVLFLRGCRVRCMPTFVLRLIAPRPNFAQTMTDAEREIMNRHAAHWRPYLERGDMVVFGPILTDDDSYGLAVVETDDEQVLRDFAMQDPVVTTGTATFEVGRMAAGHVRGR
jgi:uncharacterized protein